MAVNGAEQVTLISAGLDTGDYEAGARRIEQANTRLRDSLGTTASAGDNMGRTLGQSTTGFDRLVRRLDDSARAAFEYSRAQQQLQRGLDAGRISQERHNQLLDLAKERFLGLRPAAEAAGNSIRLQGYQVQNLTAQLVDFGVQVGSGGGLFRPLLQQSPQAVDAVGGVGNSFRLLRQNAGGILAGGTLAAVGLGLVEITAAAERNQRAINGTAVALQGAQGDYRGAAREIQAAARTLGESTTVGTDEARAALTRLAQVPGFQATRENLLEMGKLARDLGSRFGEDATQGAERLARAFADPAQAARQYFEQGENGIRGFDAAFVGHIDALVSAGRAWQAANEVAARMRGNLDARPVTELEAAWNRLKNTLTEGKNAADGASNSLGGAIASALAGVITKAADAVRGLQNLRDSWLNLPESLRQGRLVYGAGDPNAPTAPSAQPAFPGGQSWWGYMTGSGQASSGATGGAATGGRTAAPPPGLASAMDYFVSQGWTREQAAGIVANLNTESGMRPDAVGDNGQAYGVAQWHPDRQAAFASFAGRSIQGSSLEQQLAFVQHELTQGTEQAAGALLRGVTDAASAGAVVSRAYERPAERDAEAKYRGMMATTIAGGYTPANPPAATGGAAPAGAGPMAADPAGDAASRLLDARARGLRTYEAEQAAGRLRTAEADLAATPEGTSEYRDRAQQVENLRAQLEQLRPVQTEYVDALQRQNRAGAELDPTMRAVRQATQQFDEAMRQAGKTGNEPEVIAARGQVVAETLRGLTQQYAQQGDQIDRTVAAQNRIAAAWAGGAAAASHQQSVERALEDVRRSGITDTAAQAAEVERLTKRYDELAASQGRARAEQTLLNQRDTLEALGLARNMVTANEGDAARAIADLQARQMIARTPGIDPQQATLMREYARDIADSNTALRQQQDAWRDVQNVGGQAIDTLGKGLLDALGTGKWSDFRNVAIKALQDIASEMMKLAVLNPIKNALLGTNYGTMQSLGGGGGGGIAGALAQWISGGSGGYTSAGIPTTATMNTLTAQAASNVMGGAAGQHEGGVVGDGGTFTRALPYSLFREAPRYHSGGFVGLSPFMPGEVPAVLMRKELVLTEPQQRAVARGLAQPAPGRTINLAPVFNVTTPDANSFRRSQAQIAADIGSMLAAASRRT